MDHSQHSIMARKRAFFSLRRRSDKVMFVVALGMQAFSISVFVYKLKFEAPPVIVLGAVPAAQEEAEESLPIPEAPLPQPISKPKPEPVQAVKVEEVKARPPAPKAEKKAPAAAPKPEKKAAPVQEKKAPPKKAPPPPAPAKEKKSESFRLFDPGAVKSLADQDATINLFNQAMEGKPAVEVDYAFHQGRWVQVYQDLNADVSRYHTLHFLLLGDGNDNRLEFKVEDKDGTVFWVFWTDALKQTGWAMKNIPLNQLKYMAGGQDKTLDWTQVKRIYLAVSGPPSTSGKIGLADFRLE